MFLQYISFHNFVFHFSCNRQFKRFLSLFVLSRRILELTKPTFDISFEEYNGKYYVKVSDYKCDEFKMVGDYDVYVDDEL